MSSLPDNSIRQSMLPRDNELEVICRRSEVLPRACPIWKMVDLEEAALSNLRPSISYTSSTHTVVSEAGFVDALPVSQPHILSLAKVFPRHAIQPATASFFG